MNKPPTSINSITKVNELIKILTPLIGRRFILTGKTRTDGAKMRKLISDTILEASTYYASVSREYILPKKGIPKLLNELIDTYIVTTGRNYNLQVWNRNPSVKSVLIDYNDKEKENIFTTDIRYILIKVNPIDNIIESIIILTGDYIIQNFGRFGIPTLKHQFILSPSNRKDIIEQKKLLDTDTLALNDWLSDRPQVKNRSITEEFEKGNLYSIEKVYDLVAEHLIGTVLDYQPTKNRGQALELIVGRLLGYTIEDNAQLYGAFPDIRHQLIEVKVQDSPTVDLGKYTPQTKEIIKDNITTEDVRYLIALTDQENGKIEGILLTTGEKLGNYGTYVAEQSFKCQRSIPMDFFEEFKGKVVYNP